MFVSGIFSCLRDLFFIREHYYTNVGWASNSKVLVWWLNRVQDTSIASICDAPSGNCAEVTTYNAFSDDITSLYVDKFSALFLHKQLLLVVLVRLYVETIGQWINSYILLTWLILRPEIFFQAILQLLFLSFFYFFIQNQRTQVTNGWVDTKTYLVGLLASSAINVVVIFSMKEYFLSGITLRSTIKKT